MKDNEHEEKETIHAQFATVNKQMVTLTDEVAKLREAHITQNKVTTEMEIRFRNETEKLCNNEPDRDATFQGDFKRTFDEFRANLENLHIEQESLKNDDERGLEPP